MNTSETNANTGGETDDELQNALAAAFGAEAKNWLADEAETASSAMDADFAAAAAELIGSNVGTQPVEASQENELNALLDRLNTALDAGAIAPAIPNQQADGASSTGQQSVGPRHVVFEVGSQTFGLPLDGVLEIDRCGAITVLPRTPIWLRGVTNLRGQILSVTDFRNLLEIAGSRRTIGEKIIVVHSEQHDASTAVVVDRVIGIRNLKAESSPLAGLNDRVANFANGIALSGAATTVLIDPDLLLGCTELQAFMSE